MAGPVISSNCFVRGDSGYRINTEGSGAYKNIWEGFDEMKCHTVFFLDGGLRRQYINRHSVRYHIHDFPGVGNLLNSVKALGSTMYIDGGGRHFSSHGFK